MIGRAQSELQSRENLVCRLLLEKKKKNQSRKNITRQKSIAMKAESNAVYHPYFCSLFVLIGCGTSFPASSAFFFNDTAYRVVYTLSLRGVLPPGRLLP